MDEACGLGERAAVGGAGGQGSGYLCLISTSRARTRARPSAFGADPPHAPGCRVRPHGQNAATNPSRAARDVDFLSTAPAEAVEEGGLADVSVADDRYTPYAGGPWCMLLLALGCSICHDAISRTHSSSHLMLLD